MPARNLLLAVYLLGCLPASQPTPAYFASVANQALRLRGGAALGPDLSVQAVKVLEVQVQAPPQNRSTPLQKVLFRSVWAGR
jgi:hypothetical protein